MLSYLEWKRSRQIKSTEELPDAFRNDTILAIKDLVDNYGVTEVYLTGSLYYGFWSDQTDEITREIRINRGKRDRLSDIDLVTVPAVKYKKNNVEVLQMPPIEGLTALLWKKSENGLNGSEIEKLLS